VDSKRNDTQTDGQERQTHSQTHLCQSGPMTHERFNGLGRSVRRRILSGRSVPAAILACDSPP